MQVRLTRAVKFLLISCFVAFLVQQTADKFFLRHVESLLGLSLHGFLGELRFWQLFTYAFMHAEPMHLFLNLMMLAFIGGEIEALWGAKRFVKYFFFCTSVAGIVYLLFQWRSGSDYTPMVGASGGIYGLLMAYGLIFSERQLLFMMIFPMKAKHFVWALAAIEFMTTVFSHGGGLSSAAHLAGMGAGFGYLWVAASLSIAKKRRAQEAASGGKPKKRRSPFNKHLKLIIDNDPSGRGPVGPDKGPGKGPGGRRAGSSDDDDDGMGGSSPKTWH